MNPDHDGASGPGLNRPWLLFHLEEALEELQRTITGIGTDEEYDAGDFGIAMQHLYHHLNTAWNSRETDDVRTAEGSEQDFHAWRRFPTDLPL